MRFFDFVFSQYRPMYYIATWMIVPYHIPYLNCQTLYERFVVAVFCTIVYSIAVSLYRAIALKTIYGYFYIYPESFMVMSYLKKKGKAYLSEISNVTNIPINTVEYYVYELEKYNVIKKDGKMVEMVY